MPTPETKPGEVAPVLPEDDYLESLATELSKIACDLAADESAGPSKDLLE
jgi:hypothetical protein